MKIIGAFDAKTHFNALLKKVSQGETIRITLRGVPTAKLVPDDDGRGTDPSDVVRDIRRVRKGVTLRKIAIKDLIDEGRRY